MPVKLLLGDCLDIMPTLDAQSFDAIIADIPYGTTTCKWDVVIPFAPMWENLKRLAKPKAAIVLFGSQPFTSALVMSNVKMFRYEWIWDKVNRVVGYGNANKCPLKRHDNLIVFSTNGNNYNPQMVDGLPYITSARKGTTHRHLGKNGLHPQRTISNGKRYPQDILQIKADIKTEMGLHPTQKPVALLEYLVRTYTNEGDTVLDFTAGSGTLGVACVNTNRNAVLIEKDAGYFEIMQRRIADAQAQMTMDLTQ